MPGAPDQPRSSLRSRSRGAWGPAALWGPSPRAGWSGAASPSFPVSARRGRAAPRGSPVPAGRWAGGRRGAAPQRRAEQVSGSRLGAGGVETLRGGPTAWLPPKFYSGLRGRVPGCGLGWKRVTRTRSSRGPGLQLSGSPVPPGPRCQPLPSPSTRVRPRDGPPPSPTSLSPVRRGLLRGQAQTSSAHSATAFTAL